MPTLSTSFQIAAGAEDTSSYTDGSPSSQTVSLGSKNIVAFGILSAIDADFTGYLETCTLNGQTLSPTYIGRGNLLGTACSVALDTSLPANFSGDLTFALRWAWPYLNEEFLPFWIVSESPISRVGDISSGGTAGVQTGFTGDGTTAYTYAIHVSRGISSGTPNSGNEELLNTATFYGSIESVATTGSRSYGFTSNGISGHVGFFVTDGVMRATPDSMVINVTMPAPTMTVDENITTMFQSMALKVRMPEPTMTISYPRVIPLVGRDIETPGRVAPPSGLITPVLSYVDGKPTWVESTAVQRRPRRIVMRPGITDPPEPTANVAGDDYVYMEYDD